MNRFFKENKIMLSVALGIVVLFPIIILTPSPTGIIPQDIGFAIVGYTGSILGDFLTLYGVWWTIEDTKQSRKDDLELQFCPVLSAEIVRPNEKIRRLCSEIHVTHEHPGFNDTKIHYAEEVIKLTNVGRGEIKQVSIGLEECDIIATNNSALTHEIKTDNSYILADGMFDFIPIGGEVYLLVGFPAIKSDLLKSLHELYYANTRISVEIIVQGVFTSKNQYYRLNFYVNTTINKSVKKHELNDMSFIKLDPVFD